MRSVLTGRRLFWAVVIALLGPAFVLVYGFRQPQPEPPPVTQPKVTAVLPQVPGDTARAQLGRSAASNRLAAKIVVPILATPAELRSPPAAGDLPSLVLVPRAAPYTLAELVTRVPGAFTAVPAGPLLVRAHLEVPAGATLVIDGRTPDVALLARRTGFATIISRGRLTIEGTAQRPVTIVSRDANGGPDIDVTDGRPFVLQQGNRMDVEHGVFDSLGFGTGTTSGVAWVGSGGTDGTANSATNRVSGTVLDSTFSRNQFGVYTHEAEGMQVTGNTFRDNIEYGFDPHDFSNNFLVENNVAIGNGKHGFIFSRGCTGNVLRDNQAHDNVGHGFMIDDGRSTATELAQARIDPSNDNQVVDNIATDNGNNGVEIEGGTGNVVASNQLAGNYIGIRTKNDANAQVHDNTITDSVRYGIDVQDPTNGVPVTDNTISGSWGGISLGAPGSAVLTDNTVARNVNAPMVVNGVVDRQPTWLDLVVTFIRYNPLLMVWGVIVLFPLSMWILRRLVPRRVRRRRAVPV